MTRVQYLERVGSTYWFRRAVPPDVRGMIVGAKGKPITEWRYSLGVKSQEQAKRLLPAHVARSNDEIDRARAMRGQGGAPKADRAVSASPEAVRRSQAIADDMERASLEAAELSEADREATEARAEVDPAFAAQLALRAAAARMDRDREEVALARSMKVEEARKPGIDAVADIGERDDNCGDKAEFAGGAQSLVEIGAFEFYAVERCGVGGRGIHKGPPRSRIPCRAMPRR